ncbi:ORF6N domain-containing protein [Sulfurimonas sp.]
MTQDIEITNFSTFESKLIKINEELVLLDSDVADLYSVEVKRVNEAVKNNPDKFPKGYIVELTEGEWQNLKSKISTSSWGGKRKVPKAFTEKGLYMLATILKSKNATQATLVIIETFSKIKELSRNINAIMKTTDETLQQELAQKSNVILEEIIEIEPDILEDEADGEIIETTTKFEFNLGFAKVSKSIKKIKK